MLSGSGIWAGLVQVVNILTFNGVTYNPPKTPYQIPLGVQPSATVDVADPADTPVFRPPNGPEFDPNFKCDYSNMPEGWAPCSTPEDRSCWIRGATPDSNNLTEYNITTDYERYTPKGITRKYNLTVTNTTLAPDGFKMLWGKVFNDQYPGPWIQACWGDTLEVNVTNLLPYNGTTIHWHGVRQHGSLEMDGVNAVTQCPIAPADHYVYKFNLTQYGSSWLHSHYSLQYADGLLAPLTIYGPASANYDEAIDPWLVTDWVHRSAFQEFYQEIGGGTGPPSMTSILLNGRGNYTCTDDENKLGNCTTIPEPYNATFVEGTKYLIRLINTAVDSTFIFSIDNHDLTVIANDFVPLKPYTTNAVLVGIGQRYHIVVEAKKPILDNNNYWIRATPVKDCSRFAKPPEERVGIIRYDINDKSSPRSTRHEFSEECTDEPYDKLVPVIPWQVDAPSNDQQSNTFQVGLSVPIAGVPQPHGNVSRWELGTQFLWLNFSDPTIRHADNTSWQWNPDFVIVKEEDHKETDWIYMLITAQGFPFAKTPNRNFVAAAHPIHLHGHDFAVLAQSYTPYWDGTVKLKTDNPPRRDVALLPLNGYLIIAFKADNPGSWLMHCHIAWHISNGLGLQVLERPESIKLSDKTKAETERVCKNWDTWFADLNNHWNTTANPPGEDLFQDDSGV